MSLKNLPLAVKRLPLFSFLLVYIFVASGLIVTVLCILAQVVWPVNRGLYRHLVTKLAFLLLGQMIWASVDWADTRVTLYGDGEAYRNLGKEYCLITLSHRGEFDWLIGFIVAAGHNFLQTIRTLPKKSVRYVPGFGQLLWAIECVFLSRNWSKDENKIKKGVEAYAEYPFPIQIAIFCEGSRFTNEKFLQGVKYARDNDLTPLNHHLVPRTKGYAILAKSLKAQEKFTMSYDVGFAYPKDQQFSDGKQMSLWDVLAGKQLAVFFYLRKIPMNALPDSVEELQKHCHKLYVDKDTAYGHFNEHGTYPGPSKQLSFTSRQLWVLRINQLFWTLTVFVVPVTLAVHYTLGAGSFHVLYCIAALGISVIPLTYGLMAYARPKKQKQ